MTRDEDSVQGRGGGGLSLLGAALAAVLFVVSISLPAAARTPRAGPEQGKGDDGKADLEKKLRGLGPGGEAQALIERIREGMKKVDENLLSASARGVPEKMKENARYLEELLDDTRGRAGQVIRDLDRLIRSVKYMKQQSGGGGQCSQPPRGGGGESSRNRPRTERQDPGLRKNPASGEKKKAGGEKEKGEGAPRDRKSGKDKGGKPPEKPPEKMRRPDLSGRWGVLPPKIQKEILNFNIENFPEKYRKWLEEYYRRVNRRGGR